jgi:hypothetical protein
MIQVSKLQKKSTDMSIVSAVSEDLIVLFMGEYCRYCITRVAKAPSFHRLPKECTNGGAAGVRRLSSGSPGGENDQIQGKPTVATVTAMRSRGIKNTA